MNYKLLTNRHTTLLICFHSYEARDWLETQGSLSQAILEEAYQSRNVPHGPNLVGMGCHLGELVVARVKCLFEVDTSLMATGMPPPTPRWFVLRFGPRRMARFTDL